MHPQDDDNAPLPHPIRESVGFFGAAMTALRQLFWPERRTSPDGEEEVVSEAEPLDLNLAENPDCVAPFPVND